jgi:hypothetical protein
MAKAIRTCKPRGSLVPLSAQPSYIKVHGLLLQFISLFKFFFFFFFFLPSGVHGRMQPSVVKSQNMTAV